MANPSSFPTFSGMSASEIADMQSGAPGQKSEVVIAPLVRAPSSEVPLCKARTRAPAVARSAIPIAPRGRVARTTATFADPTTARITQRLHTVALHEDGLPVSAPAQPERQQPLGSFFVSFLDTLDKEQGRDLRSGCKPLRHQSKLPRPQQPKLSRPRQSRQYQQPYQQAYQQPYQQAHQQLQQWTHQHLQCPLARPRSSSQSRDDFLKRINRPYPFKREAVHKIFELLLKRRDFRLPVPVRPNQVGRDSHPNYCPYHRILGHALEDRVAFKEWLERSLEEGSVMIPEEYLADSPPRPTKVIFDLTDCMTDYADD